MNLDKTKIHLRLYVVANAPQSSKSILNIKRICEHRIQNPYRLEILDIHKNLPLAKQDHIQVVPTLLRVGAKWKKRIIGDLSSEKEILANLNLVKQLV